MIPKQREHAHCYKHNTDGPDGAERRSMLAELQRAVRVEGGEQGRFEG